MPPFYPDRPVRLERNRFGCAIHRESYCPLCCVNYTFMEDLDDLREDLDDEGDTNTSEDEDGIPELEDVEDIKTSTSPPPRISGSNARPSPPPSISTVSYPKLFSPPSPSDTPQSLFVERPAAPFSPSATGHRFTRISNPQEILLFADGYCLDNGRENPRAGCAFVYCPGPAHPGTCAFRLETTGPTGVAHKQTSNRAELRAVIAALQFCSWFGEGYSCVVIATDSEYVVWGMTEWVGKWLRRGVGHQPRDCGQEPRFVELLLREVEKFRGIAETARWLPSIGGPSRTGRKILFWRIPRLQNAQADGLAREAATKKGKLSTQ